MTRLPGLDLLRSIAIVWVMLFHSFIVGGLGPDFEWLSRFGWAEPAGRLQPQPGVFACLVAVR